MSNKMKKVISLMLAVLCSFAVLSGCKNEKTETSGDGTKLGEGYPVQSEETLTYWMNLNANLTGQYTNYGDTPFAQELQKKTGINVEYIHPTGAEQFNLMLASGDLPDIIEIQWTTAYPGGPEKALIDGNIIDHTSVFNEYAPNLQKYLEKNPDVPAMIKSYSGKYYTFPGIEPDGKSWAAYGPMVRKDWLDELGLDIPETIDDWHTMLTAFKEKKGASAPFAFFASMNGIFGSGMLTGAYDAPFNFFINDEGKIGYGSIEPGFEDFMRTFAQWYSEGLMDKSVMTLDNATLDSYMVLGKTGAICGALGSGMGKWITAGRQSDPNFDLVAVPYPVVNRGDKPKYTQMTWGYNGIGASITTNCKNVELAARLLDYGYSEEGHMLFNFGIEGESYTMVDGKATYTDKVFNDPEGASLANVLSRYMRSPINGAFNSDARYLEQYYQYQNQRDAIRIWSDSEASEHMIPIYIDVLPEDVEESTRIMNEITTFRNQTCTKYMMGVEPMDFEFFVNQIKAMGIDKVIEMKQKAYDLMTK